MDSSKKVTVKKNTFNGGEGVGGLHGKIFLKINTTFHTCYTGHIFFYILKENFKNQNVGSFISFCTLVEVD